MLVKVNEQGKVIALNTSDCNIEMSDNYLPIDKYLYEFGEGVWIVDPNWIDPTPKNYECETWNGTEWVQTSEFFAYGKTRQIKIEMPCALTVVGGIFSEYLYNIMTYKTPYELNEAETNNTIWLKTLLPTDETALKNTHHLGVRIYKIV